MKGRALAGSLGLLLAAVACKPAPATRRQGGEPAEVPSAPSASSEAVPPSPPDLPPLTLSFGGDVDLGRALGRRLVKEPDYQPFAAIVPWLERADVRFVNLESPLSDQRGELQSPQNPLVFNGPPHAAKTLAAAGIDIVSTANNHAFDYGESGVLGTLESLRTAHVESVGTGPFVEAAERMVVVERKSKRVAFLAATDVWNQGPSKEARGHVASADGARLIAAIQERRLDDSLEAIVVSVHAGEEYQEAPPARVRLLFRSLIDAGADVVVGHHPHVPQGVETHGRGFIFYSLGNLVMRMHDAHPETGTSFLGRVTLGGAGPPVAAICPFRIVGHEPRPLARDVAAGALLASFAKRFASRNQGLGEGVLGPWQSDGCAALITPAR